ncbi:MAG: hypothetical protein HFE76_00900 [Firmicutes bacterium]|nr:hypothetical protein [Bacillota bacterium]
MLAEIQGNSALGQEEIRQMILNSYIADMAKYAKEEETVKIFAVYDSLPAQLANMQSSAFNTCKSSKRKAAACD